MQQRGRLIGIAGLVLAWSAARAEILIGASGPLTGTYAWYGEGMARGVEAALEDLNATGGVLGERVRMVPADDGCSAEQGMAAVSLIERELRRVFRLVGRDDRQGELAAALIAEARGGKRVAIVHDGQGYDMGLAEQVKRALNERGVQEVALESVQRHQLDFGPLLARLQEVGGELVYYGGYSAEAARLVRQARFSGHGFEMIGSDALHLEHFGLVAGPAATGVIFSLFPDARGNPEAVAKLRATRFEPDGMTLYHDASVQVWPQAVEKARTLGGRELAKVLRRERFPTVLGGWASTPRAT